MADKYEITIPLFFIQLLKEGWVIFMTRMISIKLCSLCMTTDICKLFITLVQSLNTQHERYLKVEYRIEPHQG